MNLAEAAVSYSARRGWPVFPCRGKAPFTRRGFKDASLDPKVIRGWWERWPDANIGVPCGPAGLVVIDVDLPDGIASIQELSRAGYRLPPTLSAITGGNGAHYFYKAVTPLRNTTGKLPGVPFPTPGIDLRAGGGYVIVPPSKGPDGVSYEFLGGGWPRSVVPAPEWLRDVAPDDPSRPFAAPMFWRPDPYATAAMDKEVDAMAMASPGSRNDQLNRSAFALGQFVAAGRLPAQKVIDVLYGAALQAGLGDREALRTIDSGMRSGQKEPRRG